MRRRFLFGTFVFAIPAALGLFAPGGHPADAAPETRRLDDYKYFRSLSIDLAGRFATRDELAAFERSDWSRDRFIDDHLNGSAYADRMTRVYMDLLRLEAGNAVNVNPPATTLRRETIQGPDGKPTYVYFRRGQRRSREATDGEFCLTKEETGLEFITNAPPRGTPISISKEALDASTVLVRPWWLYQDYASAHPVHRYAPKVAPVVKPDPPKKDGKPETPKKAGETKAEAKREQKAEAKVEKEAAKSRKPGAQKGAGDKTKDEKPPEPGLEAWSNADPSYQPDDKLLLDADGEPTVEIRVCKEEAQTKELGTIYASGRPNAVKGQAPPFGRLRPLPNDDPYALKHKGEAISCRGIAASTMSVDCGCGVGLSACTPGDSNGETPGAFALPSRSALDDAEALPATPQSISNWYKHWWTDEAVRFFGRIFREDKDFREILTAKNTEVNGPLAFYYRSTLPGSCCGRERQFGLAEETEPLFDPKNVPASLHPYDNATWVAVPTRGDHAAGILTMPIFLEKFASRRARAAVVYNALLCKNFVAGTADLKPSTEPNLMVRPGCSNCHATLEPLAAYFSRVEETSAVYLPEKNFPSQNATCKVDKKGKTAGSCVTFYDPAFSNDKMGELRGAYASEAHAKDGPAGLALEIVRTRDFASCAVDRVATSFLGRALTPDDEAWENELTEAFIKNDYRMKPLVGAIVRSDQYVKRNNALNAAPPIPLGSQAPKDEVHGAMP